MIISLISLNFLYFFQMKQLSLSVLAFDFFRETRNSFPIKFHYRLLSSWFSDFLQWIQNLLHFYFSDEYGFSSTMSLVFCFSFVVDMYIFFENFKFTLLSLLFQIYVKFLLFIPSKYLYKGSWVEKYHFR